MRSASLQITYRRGKPYVAYLYLPRKESEPVSSTARFSEELVIDYGQDGKPIGIEIVSPGYVTSAEIKALLAYLKLDADLLTELAPVLSDPPLVGAQA